MKFAVTGFISIMSKHAAEPEIEHPGASWNLAALKFFEKSEFNHPSLKELTTLSVNSSSHLKSCTAMKFAVTGLIGVLSKHAELTLEFKTRSTLELGWSKVLWEIRVQSPFMKGTDHYVFLLIFTPKIIQCNEICSDWTYQCFVKTCRADPGIEHPAEHSGARLIWVSLLKWSQLYSQIPTSSPAPPDLSLKCEWKYLQTEVSIQSNICAEMFCKSHKFVKAKYRRSWSGEYGGLAG